MSSPNLADILGRINDGVCVFGPDEQISFMNERAAKIVGGADEDFHDKIRESMKEAAARHFEHFHAGLNRFFEHHTYPNTDGGLTLISYDTTSRHRLEQAFRASEERLRRVIESNIIGVIVVEDGLITEANDIFLTMVNQTREDVVRRQLRWREMTPSEFDTLDAKARSELVATGVFPPYEKELLRKDGSTVSVLVAGVAVQTGSETRETLCLVLDLSQRKRAEERTRTILECGKILASSLECERTFLELAEFIVSSLGDSCVIFLQENGRLKRMAGAQSNPVDEAEPQALINRVMTTGTSELATTPVSRVLVPIIARDEIMGALVVTSSKPDAFDAEDVRLFEALGRRSGLALDNARLYYEAQKANRLKDEFVAIVSHELRTPLTPILGGVYMMRSEPHDERVFARALDLIERNAKSQVKIVDDLLDMSRALSGKLRLNMVSIDLQTVIQAAVETVRPASEAKDITIDAHMESISGSVSGDADRLQQVVWNLLANAVKFTPNGGEVKVELVETPGFAEVRVSDTGIGIDAEFLPYVFEKFRQADTSRTRHGGLGLGLAIARHIVESHGGTVQARSVGKNRGSTFIVKLPLRTASRIGAAPSSPNPPLTG
jgi:PAS domain S-box-containing protein